MAEAFIENDSYKTAQTNLKKLLEVALTSDLQNGIQLDESLLLQQFQDVSNSMNEPINDRYLMPEFFQFCSEGKYDEIEAYLKKGQNPNEVGPKGETALMCAISSTNSRVVQLLLDHQTNPNLIIETNDTTPLIEAASRGCLRIVQLLLDYGADPDIKTNSKKMASHVAAAAGNQDICVAILEKSRDKTDLIEQLNENGHTVLMEAATSGNLVLVKYLVSLGAHINTPSAEFKETSLTLASYKGYEKVIAFLLESGADHDHKTDEMHTALMEASMEGHYNAVKILLDYGANTNIRYDSFETALTLASCSGHADVVGLLLWYGSDIEEINDELYTPLMEASREGHLDVVVLLVTCGAKINRITDETQETALTLAACGGFYDVVLTLHKLGADLEIGAASPLMEASQEGHIDVVRLLLKLGARIEANNAAKETSIHLAAENGHADICHLLIESGADLEALSEDGKTPLMKACRAGNLDVVKLFVKCGVNINYVNSQREFTALTIACANGSVAVVEYLLQQGADSSIQLKDNITVLSEASRSGHANVVKFLLSKPLFSPQNASINNFSSPNSTSQLELNTNSPMPAAHNPLSAQLMQQPANLLQHTLCQHASKSNIDCLLDNSQTDGNLLNPNNFMFTQQNQLSPLHQQSTTNESALSTISPDQKVLQNMMLDSNSSNLEEFVKCLYTGLNPTVCQDYHNQSPTMQPLQLTTSNPNDPDLDNATATNLPLFSNLDQSANVTNILDHQLIANIQINPSQSSSPSSSNCSSSSSTTNPHSSNRKIKKARHSEVYCDDTQRSPAEFGDVADDDMGQQKNTSRSFKSLNSTSLQPLSQSQTNVITSSLPQSLTPLNAFNSTNLSDLTSRQNNTKDLSNATTDPCGDKNSNYGQNDTASSSTSSNNFSSQKNIFSNVITPSLSSSSRSAYFSSSTKQGVITMAKTSQSMSNVLPDEDRGSSEPKRIATKLNMNHASNMHDDEAANARFSNLFSTPNNSLIPSTPDNNFSQFSSSTHNNLSINSNHVIDLSASSTSSSISLSPLKPPSFQKTVLQPKRRLQQTQKIMPKHHINSSNLNNLMMAVPNSFDRTKSLSESTVNPMTGNLFPSATPFSVTDFNCNFNFSDQHSTNLKSQYKPPLFDNSSNSNSSSNLSSSVTNNGDLNSKNSHRLSSNSNFNVLTMQNMGYSKSHPTASMFSLNSNNNNLENSCCNHIADQDLELFSQADNSINNKNAQFNLIQEQQRNLGVVRELENEEDCENCIECHRSNHNKLQTNPYLVQGPVFPQNSNENANNGIMSGAKSHSHNTAVRDRRNAGDTNINNNKRPSSHSSKTNNEAGSINHSHQSHQTQNGEQVAFNVNVLTESNQESPLTIACINGHGDVVRVLVQNGAVIEHRDKKSQTPLHLSIINGHPKVTKALLDLGADIEALLEKNKDSPLGLAASHGQDEIIQELASRGALLEHRNLSDYTPLCIAANSGHLDCVRELLNAGAEINSRTNSRLGISPLMLAAMNGHVEIVEELLTRGSDINAQIETNRNSALTLACSQGKTEVVRLLVERNVALEHRPKNGLTPLMETAMQGHVSVGEVLLKAGADPNAAPVLPSRDTSLIMAAEKGHTEYVRLLLSHNAIVDARNKKGDSALWLACSGGYLEIVKLLLDAGADPNVADNRRITCLVAAFHKGHEQVVEEMVKYVTQFPSEIDCNKHIKPLLKQQDNLAKRCENCRDTILEAKERQEFEAAKNAENLLEEVENEKKLQELREVKLAKKREKKKAKKKAKQGEKESNNTMANQDNTKSNLSNDQNTSLTTAPELKEPASKEVKVEIKEKRPKTPEIPDSKSQFISLVSNTNNDSQKISEDRRLSDSNSKPFNGIVPNKQKKEKQTVPNSTTKPLNNSAIEKMNNLNSSRNTTNSAPKIWSSIENSTTSSKSEPKSSSNNQIHNWQTIGLNNKRKVDLHIPVNKKEIGKVIGQGGSVVNALRQISGAHIDIDSTANYKDERIVHLKGLNDSVLKAKELIQDLVDGRVTGIEVVHESTTINTNPQTFKDKSDHVYVNSYSNNSSVSSGNESQYQYYHNGQTKSILPIVKTSGKSLNSFNTPTTLNSQSNNVNVNIVSNSSTTTNTNTNSLPQYGFSKSSNKVPVSTDFATVAAAGIVTNNSGNNHSSISSHNNISQRNPFLNSKSEYYQQRQQNCTTSTVKEMTSFSNNQFPSLSEIKSNTKHSHKSHQNKANMVHEPLEINTNPLNSSVTNNATATPSSNTVTVTHMSSPSSSASSKSSSSPSIAPTSKSFPLAPGSERSMMHQRTYNSTPEHSPKIPDNNNTNSRNNTNASTSNVVNELNSSADSAIDSNNSDKDELLDYPQMSKIFDTNNSDIGCIANSGQGSNDNNENVLQASGINEYPKLYNLNPQAQIFSPNYFASISNNKSDEDSVIPNESFSQQIDDTEPYNEMNKSVEQSQSLKSRLPPATLPDFRFFHKRSDNYDVIENLSPLMTQSNKNYPPSSPNYYKQKNPINLSPQTYKTSTSYVPPEERTIRLQDYVNDALNLLISTGVDRNLAEACRSSFMHLSQLDLNKYMTPSEAQMIISSLLSPQSHISQLNSASPSGPDSTVTHPQYPRQLNDNYTTPIYQANPPSSTRLPFSNRLYSGDGNLIAPVPTTSINAPLNRWSATINNTNSSNTNTSATLTRWSTPPINNAAPTPLSLTNNLTTPSIWASGTNNSNVQKQLQPFVNTNPANQKLYYNNNSALQPQQNTRQNSNASLSYNPTQNVPFNSSHNSELDIIHTTNNGPVSMKLLATAAALKTQNINSTTINNNSTNNSNANDSQQLDSNGE